MFKLVVDANGNPIPAFPLKNGMVNLTSGTHEARGLYCVADGQVVLNNYTSSPTIDVVAGEVFTFVGTTITILSGKYHLA